MGGGCRLKSVPFKKLGFYTLDFDIGIIHKII